MNKFQAGYWRLKKENHALKQALKDAIALTDEYKQTHEDEIISLCDEIDGLRMLAWNA